MNRLRLLAAGLVFVGMAHAGAPAPASYELALVDMQGQKNVLGRLPTSVFAPRVSPDGKRVAFELDDAPVANQSPVTRLYVAPIDQLDKREVLQQTVISTRNIAPVWSPEGDWIAFMATGNGGDQLFWQRSDGGIQPLFLADGRAPEGLYDGGKLAFITLAANRDYGISLLDVHTKKVTKLVDLPGSEQHSSRISPDGKWITYVSNETGRYEVWLEPIPQTGRRFQLTKSGGRHPVWSPDGSRIYFDQGGRMYRLDLTLGAEASAGAPAELPISGFQQIDLRRQFDLMPDGRSFLMLFPSGASPTVSPITPG
jgi:Tol biopolymer transport system component